MGQKASIKNPLLSLLFSFKSVTRSRDDCHRNNHQPPISTVNLLLFPAWRRNRRTPRHRHSRPHLKLSLLSVSHTFKSTPFLARHMDALYSTYPSFSLPSRRDTQGRRPHVSQHKTLSGSRSATNHTAVAACAPAMLVSPMPLALPPPTPPHIPPRTAAQNNGED